MATKVAFYAKRALKIGFCDEISITLMLNHKDFVFILLYIIQQICAIKYEEILQNSRVKIKKLSLFMWHLFLFFFFLFQSSI